VGGGYEQLCRTSMNESQMRTTFICKIVMFINIVHCIWSDKQATSCKIFVMAIN